jgi:hypothetical protein
MWPKDNVQSNLQWRSLLSTLDAPVPSEQTKFLRKVCHTPSTPPRSDCLTEKLADRYYRYHRYVSYITLHDD